VTEPGRAAVFMVVSWLLAAVAMLAARGALVPFLLAVVPGSVVVLVLRALVRWQRAPSVCDQPTRSSLPDRYRVADDLRRSVADVVAAAEAEAGRR
jgi:hypothetical protein